jgi:GntR family transcriptional regulator, carbon starvation induced regulator
MVLDGHLPETPPTRSEWVDQRLREAILSGNLEPGERLVVSALSERWQVSPTPLREAFQRLAADGLVELAPQRGARVTPVSVTDLLEVYELREILEPLALRRSLERTDPSWRQSVTESYERLVDSLRNRPHDLLEMEEKHRQFHGALLSRCESSWLLRLVSTLAEHSVRYRLLSITPRGGPEEVIGEHERLLQASLAGDIEKAVVHLTRHLQLTVESLAQSETDGHQP